MKKSAPSLITTVNGKSVKVDKVVKTICPRNCFDTCSVLGYVKDGRMLKVEGDPNHPITRGHLCVKANTYVQRTYHKDRIKYPLLRVGKRGRSEFKRVSWDEAYDYLVDKLEYCKRKWGGESLVEYVYSGNREFLAKTISGRFLNLFGSSKLVGSFCILSGLAGATFTTGTQHCQGIETWSKKAEVIMIVGHNSSFTNVHSLPFLWDAMERGAYLIVIDSYLTPIATKADLFLQPRPGTDAAMVLAMINHIVKKNLHDKGFIANYAYGFDELMKECSKWTLEKAAKVTGIEPEKIAKAAEIYATHHSHMETGWGHQRYTNGHQTQRAYSCLAAVCGHVGKEGASCNYFELLAYKGLLNFDRVMYPKGAPHKTLKRRLVNISTFGPALREAKNPPIKAVISWRGGLISQHPDVHGMTAALKKLELFVSSELFMTDDTDWADLVLPASDTFEQWGVHPSYWHHYLQLQLPVIEPLYESKPDIDFWCELGRRMGYEKFFPKEYTGLDWIKEFLADDIGRDTIKNALASNDPIRVPEKYAPRVPWSDRIFDTPTGKVELYSTGMVEKGKKYPGDWHPVPHFEETAESPVSRPDLYKKYPLMLISQHAPYRTHSQWFNIEEIQEIEGPPSIFINEKDAADRGIEIGDRVKVFNGRGEISVIAKLTNRIKAGVCEVNSGIWVKSNGSANVLLEQLIGGPRDVGAGIMEEYDFERDGHTIAYFNCLVQITKEEVHA
jgi:anaerobic selenocysteine-containing dehydrogenase